LLILVRKETLLFNRMGSHGFFVMGARSCSTEIQSCRLMILFPFQKIGLCRWMSQLMQLTNNPPT